MDTIVRTVDYIKGKVVIIDQTLLPAEEKYVEIGDTAELAAAIRILKVRGAPALGVAAAHGILLELENEILAGQDDPHGYIFDHGDTAAAFDASGLDGAVITAKLLETADMLAATRPTAVNLFWAIERMRKAIKRSGNDISLLAENVSTEAFAIHDGELETDRRIGENGAALLSDGMVVLTHCNAGGLATAGYGTALAVIKTAHEQGNAISVFADETRPLLQGARLTAWEMTRAGIDVTVLCDNAAASLFAAGRIDAVVTGADRIVLNGDSANKIGTLGLAVLCEKYGVPMYIAAPWSTFDLTIENGSGIPIEERDQGEVKSFAGIKTAPDEAKAYNPAFDVTPAELLTAIITHVSVIIAVR
ncbi:MAG: S-methyl-5-thioribose-1-phosphate isomerase, partial [Candidatus Krumholzibacteria bacterium]|nr:S-methyl-5-thioribose-1-phosphate isomerase [Candidatus Krumholzibacteria bacterium]